MFNIFYYQTDIGKIGIAENNNLIINLYFEANIPDSDVFIIKETEVLNKAGKQLNEYLHGLRKEFTVPLSPQGTDFMKKVWYELCKIPYGETRSYKEIAETIDNSKAYRAVGLANNKNPIPIFIPCHRVIGANGSLVGYAGGTEVKKHLLELEKH